MNKQTIVINGNSFSDLETFFVEVDRKLKRPALEDWTQSKCFQ